MKRILMFMALLTAVYCRIAVMYAHEKLSDWAVNQCINEMYPKGRVIHIEESDEPCIIFCVFKKIGIMSSNGFVNLEVYKNRLLTAHQLARRPGDADYKLNCVESIDSIQHKQDVCRKAKAFNDCTHLYRMILA